jgi:FADH2 O2-dependent halogenase
MVDFDVGIIGGGPAGSAMGAYLARAGVRCVILEGEIFPRAHVGESLVPASTRVFKELEFIPEMDRLGFVRKFGATWTSNPSVRPYEVNWQGLDDDCHAAIRFDEREQEGVDLNYTWHVDRGLFDQALLQHAHASGAEVYEGVRVLAVDFDRGDPELVFKMGRREHRLRVRLVADASGRKTLLGRQLGLKRTDPVFDQYAIHSWFSGYARHELDNPDHIHIHFLPHRGTWVWQIPITDDVTSIGVVTQKANFKAAGASREAFFYECLRSRPDVGALVDRAERIRKITEEADYSYAMKQFCGDRYVLLGDAARFVDPIFSSGVSIALNSARFASRDVIQALASGRFERESYQTFESTMKVGVKNWYDFICLYYRLNVLFTYFIRDKQYRLDVLKLLQGDVYDRQPPVLDRMREKIQEVEGNPRHIWHGLLSEVSATVLAQATA